MITTSMIVIALVFVLLPPSQARGVLARSAMQQDVDRLVQAAEKLTGTWPLQPPPAIQEVAIQTSNFEAEYGQAGGGYFNYTMKSGTNQLHGSAYDYFVNEALNAGLPFTSNPNGGHVRNPIRQNDYGFTIGAPIRIPKVYNGHDRTFFFFNFEQFRQSTFTSNTIDRKSVV